MRTRLRFLFMLLFFSLTWPSAVAQSHQIPEEQPLDESHAKILREQAKKLNLQRHETLKRDTDKLLQLATELKQYVDKSNANMLSFSVIKKADEIEKLAHNVKEKMKGY
ncbi:MAG TPA: hypothetical protein VFI95_17345 [Terriglobales bacterium]|nr:hypothetical protein [Terriglobales bacterium]